MYHRADELYEIVQNFLKKQWHLRCIPFSEKTVTGDTHGIRKPFTGRDDEIKAFFGALSGNDPKHILIYGWYGIGKTAFIMQVLDTIQRKHRSTLAAYIQLPLGTDLSTAAFLALARKLSNDPWAREALMTLGIRPSGPAVKRKAHIGAKTSAADLFYEEESLPLGPITYSTAAFNSLLDVARKKYQRVIIAIDDLDKRDPALMRNLMQDAQDLFQSQASIILTGHPHGLTRDVVITENGLIDVCIELKPMDERTMGQMLIDYLQSVRIMPSLWQVISGRIFKTDNHDDVLHPFTEETAPMLCKQSEGYPRWFNRVGTYVLNEAIKQNAELITPDIFNAGVAHLGNEIQTKLNPNQRYIMELALEKGVITQDTITDEELGRLGKVAFSDILPILEELVRLDVICQTRNDNSIEFRITPLMAKPE